MSELKLRPPKLQLLEPTTRQLRLGDGSGEGLIEIGEDVVDVLDADA
jgi:hypothetical protein